MTASTRIFRCETHLLVDQAIVVARTSLQIIVHNTCHIHIKPRCRCCLPRRLHAVTYATTHHMAATRHGAASWAATLRRTTAPRETVSHPRPHVHFRSRPTLQSDRPPTSVVMPPLDPPRKLTICASRRRTALRLLPTCYEPRCLWHFSAPHSLLCALFLR